MGLDDFVSDEDREEWKSRKEELKQNTPPSDADKWREHEPGVPDWLGFIECDNREITQEDLDKSEDEVKANLLQETGDGIEIKITGVDSTAIVCTNPEKLELRR